MINCQATYLTFSLPTSDKGCVRPVRDAPTLVTYEKCVVMPYHEAGNWKRLKPINIPETVSYKARRAQDGEMEVGTGEGQPEHKDSTERMQDLAEEEIGEGESASQRVIGPATPLSFSTFKSKFEPYEEGGMVLKKEEFEELQTYVCPMCRSLIPYEYEVDEFRSLQQLSEHVKAHHDVTFYSSTTYSCQQILCGRLIKAAHMWLHKENQTFGKSYLKERKIKRRNEGGPRDPFLETPIETLEAHQTPVPPKLTAEKVQRGPIVRPEHPTTSLAVQDLDRRGFHKMSAGLSVQEWSVKAAHGLLGTDPAGILRQVDPIYSPVDLYPGPSGETPTWWFTPQDAKMIIRLAGNKEFEENQKILFSLFMSAIQLVRESRLRPRLMDSVYNFTNIGVMIAPLPLRHYLRPEHDPQDELYRESEWEFPLAVHGMVRGAEDETRVATEWQELFGKYYFPAIQLPPKRICHLRSDDVTRPESQIHAENSGLNSVETPMPKVIYQLCQMGLSEQAVTLEHPVDNTQTIAHKMYSDMVTKHRGVMEAVRLYISANPSWVDLMTSSTMDDGPETAVSIHLEDPPNRVTSIKTKIKGLASGIWDVVKEVTERIAPTIVKTPATTKKKEPTIDPVEFGSSVPQNTVITTKHNRRFDWEEFSRDLLEEVKKAPKDWKPVIHHKAPPIFHWHENKAWDPMERVSKRLTVPIGSLDQ